MIPVVVDRCCNCFIGETSWDLDFVVFFMLFFECVMERIQLYFGCLVWCCW